MRPRRLIRSAIVVKPSTLLRLHRALIHRKYRRVFSSKGPTKPGPKGPSQEVIAAVVDMKQRNPISVLHHADFRAPFFATLRENEETYAEMLETHFGKHFAPFDAAAQAAGD